jgi:hypothetical protein
MRKIYFFTLFLGLNYLQAQSISPQSVNSGGTKMSQNNGSLSFTVGELVVLTLVDSDGNTLGGGFTSSSTISTATIEEPNSDILNVNVYPNPTTDLLTVAIQDTKLAQVTIEVSDINGRVVSSGKYAGIANNIGINTSSWEIGNYFLYLKNTENEILGTYKIVKQ